MQKFNFLKATLACLGLFFLNTTMNAQCINTSQYQTNAAPTSGSITLNTCFYTSEYTEVTGVAAATNYRSTAFNNTSSNPVYITVTELTSGGTVVAHGLSPLTWTSNTAGNHYIHFTDDAACASTSACHTSTLEFLGTAFCLTPSGIATSNITTTTADISWTAGNPTQSGWEVSVVPQGNPAVGGTASATGNYTATGLTASTSYDIYVREICAVGDTSSWTGPVNFVTTCAVFTPVYLEEFNTFVPTCWVEASDGSPQSGPTGIGTSEWGATSYLNAGGANDATKINLYNTGINDWLLSPTFDLSAGGWELVINAGVTAYNATGSSAMGSDDTVQVLISVNSGATWTAIYTWDVNNTPSNTGNAYIIDLSAYTSANAQFAIWATEGTIDDAEDFDFHINDFEIRFPPSCPEPTLVNVTNITATSAEIGWTAGGASQQGWEVSVVATGSPAQGGTGSATNNYTATGLSATTTYDVYVREICAPGDTSTWVGPISFTTPCAIFVPPYIEEFNTFIPTCWDEAADGDPQSGPTGIGIGEWNATTFVNAGGTNDATKINLYNTGTNDWLLSPDFDLSAGGWQLVISAGVTEWNNSNPSAMGSDDTVQVLISVNSGATWQPIYTWDVNNTPSNTGDTYTIDLSAYTSANAQFAIWATEGTNDDAEDFDFHISDFELQVPPNDVSASAFLGVNSPYCNSIDSLSAFLIISNNSPNAETNVPYTLELLGLGPVGGGVIPSLASNASDTVAIGPFPAQTGQFVFTAYTSLSTDAINSNDSVTITVLVSNTTVSFDSIQNVSCNGLADGSAKAVAIGGLGTYTFAWDALASNQITATANGLAAGDYSVITTDTVGCASIDTVTISEPTMLMPAVTDDGTGTSATASATGGTPGYNYQWDAAAGAQTDAQATGLVPGTYCVTVTDDNGCTADSCITIVATSIYNIANSNTFKVFPNPSSGQINIGLRHTFNGTYQLQMYNLVGKKVFERELDANDNQAVLNLSDLQNGVYMMQFELQKKLYTHKIVIQKD